jgi:hypothetical protein
VKNFETLSGEDEILDKVSFDRAEGATEKYKPDGIFNKEVLKIFKCPRRARRRL